MKNRKIMLLKFIGLLKKFRKFCICYKIKNELIKSTSISLAFIFIRLRSLRYIARHEKENIWRYLTTQLASLRFALITFLIQFYLLKFYLPVFLKTAYLMQLSNWCTKLQVLIFDNSIIIGYIPVGIHLSYTRVQRNTHTK